MKRIIILIVTLISFAFIAKSESKLYEITEYKWRDDRYYSNDISLKNNSGYDAEIEVTALFKDANGNIIGVSSKVERACQNGYETFWSFFLEEEFDSCEFIVEMKPDIYYQASQSEVDYSMNIVNKKVIISAKNNFSKPIMYLKYHILYLNIDGGVVDYDWGHIMDSDSELKPDKTRYVEEETESNFDSIKLYMKGYSE